MECTTGIWWVPHLQKYGDISVAHYAGCATKNRICVAHPTGCATEMWWAHSNFALCLVSVEHVYVCATEKQKLLWRTALRMRHINVFHPLTYGPTFVLPLSSQNFHPCALSHFLHPRAHVCHLNSPATSPCACPCPTLHVPCPTCHQRPPLRPSPASNPMSRPTQHHVAPLEPPPMKEELPRHRLQHRSLTVATTPIPTLRWTAPPSPCPRYTVPSPPARTPARKVFGKMLERRRRALERPLRPALSRCARRHQE